MPAENEARELEARVCGAVLRPGQAGYAEEVAGFNLATTHTPEVVVAATSAADVVAAVAWAARVGMPVGVQATGHGANAAVDHGLLISTRHLTDIAVDPSARAVARATSGSWSPR